MSHFTVAVIIDKSIEEDSLYDAVDDALAPYDEGLRTDPVIYKKKSDIIAGILKEQEEMSIMMEEYKNDPAKYEEKFGSWLTRKMENFVQEKRYSLTDTELFDIYMKENNDDGYDEEGNQLTTYNPDSKWDWFQIGGRWSGLIDGKDYSRIKDIDFDKLKPESPEFYNKNPVYQEAFATFEEYQNFEKYKFSYAVLDSKENKWYEAGEMGWFAMTNSTYESEINHMKTCQKLFTEVFDPKDWVVIVDCHI